MDLRTAIRDAVQSLRQNRMRSALTMTGITIGICAVICTVAIGQGGQAEIQQQLQNLGDNLVWIEAGARNVNGRRTGAYGTKSLRLDDAQAIARLPVIKTCSPNVDGHTQVTYQNQNWSTRFRGVAPSFLPIEHWTIGSGTAFTASDLQHLAKVCILGSTVAQQLFPAGDSLGKTIRIGSLPFVVVGGFDPKGASTFGWDQDDIVMVPYTVAMKELIGQDWLDDIMCSAVSPAAIPSAETQIGKLLRLQHGLHGDQPDDFNIRHPDEALQALAESNRTFTLMLASIASVSLLVGGIGIMNIMLVTVTERTREIGVRMAVGATRRDVQLQFLLESVMLSLAGGAAGVACGIIATLGLAHALAWPAMFSIEALVMAVAVAVGTGVFFGFYPARRAAALDPIEALRYE